MTKVIRGAPSIPGGSPDRPKKMGQGPECTTKGCKRASRQQGLCAPCHEDHVDAIAKEPTAEQWNDAFEKAKDS